MDAIIFWLIVAAVIAGFYGPMMGDKGDSIQSFAIIFLLALFLWPLMLVYMAFKFLIRLLEKILEK